MAMGICLPAMRRRRFWAVLVICLFVSPGRAGAANLSDDGARSGGKDAKQDKDAKQESKARFVSGQSHYNLNEFTAALGDFKEAYRLLPDPVFLYNLGQCERQLGHPEEAIRFYRSFLREQPKAANRQDVARKIDEMEATLKAKPTEVDKSAAPPAEAESLAPADQEAKQGLGPTDMNQAAPPTATPAPALAAAAIPTAAPPASAHAAEGGLARMDLTVSPPAPAASETPAFYSHWWFWPAAGVLAVGAGVGIYAATASRSPAVPSSTLGSKTVF